MTVPSPTARTVTLVSHPGARAREPYGPQNFKLDDTIRPLIEVTYLRSGHPARFGHHADSGLLHGQRWQDAFPDLEIVDETLTFSGEVPFDDGSCHRPQLLFTDGWVWTPVGYSRAGQMMVAFVTSANMMEVSFRPVGLEELFAHLHDPVTRRRVSGYPVEGMRLNRRVAQVSEAAEVAAAARPGMMPAVTVLDAAGVAEFLDIAARLKVRVTSLRKDLGGVADGLRAAADDAERIATSTAALDHPGKLLTGFRFDVSDRVRELLEAQAALIALTDPQCGFII